MKRNVIFCVMLLSVLVLQPAVQGQQPNLKLQFILFEDEGAASLQQSLVYSIPDVVGKTDTYANDKVYGVIQNNNQLGYLFGDDPRNPQGQGNEVVLTISRTAVNAVEIWANFGKFYAPSAADLYPRGYGPEFRLKIQWFMKNGKPFLQVRNLGTHMGYLDVNDQSSKATTMPESYKDRNVGNDSWYLSNGGFVGWGVYSATNIGDSYSAMVITKGNGTTDPPLNFGKFMVTIN